MGLEQHCTSTLRLRSTRAGRNVEVKNIFADAQLGVQGDSWGVTVVGLDKDDVDSSGRGELLEVFDEACSHAAPTVGFLHCEVVDVELGASLFELR